MSPAVGAVTLLVSPAFFFFPMAMTTVRLKLQTVADGVAASPETRHQGFCSKRITTPFILVGCEYYGKGFSVRIVFQPRHGTAELICRTVG
jgi:hypothetical protein